MSTGVLAVLFLVQVASAEYSEPQAIDNFYLSVSAYCGTPKFNGTFLGNWECGPACSNAGKVEEITQFDDSSKGVFGFTGHYDGHCIIAFRGTSSADGWKTDLAATLVDFNNSGCPGCKVEKGFYEGYLAVRPIIVASLSRYSCQDLSITGHSLGAALGTLAAYDLGPSYTIKDVYNFGSPRVGNPAFASSYGAKFPNTYRVTHHKDPVPHGPTLGMGFQHVAGEIFYDNTTEGGYKTCKGGEDKSCADQFGGNLIADIGLALCCADNHLEYMQNAVSIATDGDSCTHVAVATAVRDAYLTTAAYCEPESLRQWDCGTPCDRVEGGVQQVQVLDVPFESTFPGSSRSIKGSVRGFVGHGGDRCLLSLQEPFSLQQGLSIIEATTHADLRDLGKHCKGCQVSKVLLDALHALEGPLAEALQKIGCTKDADSTSYRRLIVVGHGLGSSLGALAAFELKNGTGLQKGSFGIESGFQFGAARVGNQAFVDAFRHKVAHDIFRVTHHKDPYVHYPSHDNGFVHMDQELFFDGDATWDPSSYTRCPADGEDPHCAQQHKGSLGPLSDHTKYLQPLVEVDMTASACKQAVIWT